MSKSFKCGPVTMMPAPDMSKASTLATRVYFDSETSLSMLHREWRDKRGKVLHSDLEVINAATTCKMLAAQKGNTNGIKNIRQGRAKRRPRQGV